MNLGLRILRTAAITLAVVVGLPVGCVLWTNATWVRQDIRVDTGEIREVREGVLWNSSPENIHETVVTPVLKQYGIDMKAQGDPWVFFNRVHAFGTMGGDYPLEHDLLATTDPWDNAIKHIHYGGFLDAVAQYRSPQEAALWWKSLLFQETHWRRTQMNRRWMSREILHTQSSPFASKQEFDLWYSRLITELHSEPSRARFIPLFDEIHALYSAPPPKP